VQLIFIAFGSLRINAIAESRYMKSASHLIHHWLQNSSTVRSHSLAIKP